MTNMTKSVSPFAAITIVPEAAVPAEAALSEETAAVPKNDEEVIRREMIDTAVVTQKPAKEPEAAGLNYSQRAL